MAAIANDDAAVESLRETCVEILVMTEALLRHERDLFRVLAQGPVTLTPEQAAKLATQSESARMAVVLRLIAWKVLEKATPAPGVM